MIFDLSLLPEALFFSVYPVIVAVIFGEVFGWRWWILPISRRCPNLGRYPNLAICPFLFSGTPFHLLVICGGASICYGLIYVWCDLGRIQAELLDILATSKFKQAEDASEEHKGNSEPLQPNRQLDQLLSDAIKLQRKAFLLRRNAGKTKVSSTSTTPFNLPLCEPPIAKRIRCAMNHADL